MGKLVTLTGHTAVVRKSNFLQQRLLLLVLHSGKCYIAGKQAEETVINLHCTSPRNLHRALCGCPYTIISVQKFQKNTCLYIMAESTPIYVTLPPKMSCIDTRSQYTMQRFSICKSKILIFSFHQNWVLQA